MTTDMHEIHDYPENTTDRNQNMSTEAPATDIPLAPEETSAVKRQRFMSNSAYKESGAHQAAGLTWATVEVKEAVDAQTEVLAVQTAALREQATLLHEQTAVLREQAAAFAEQTAATRELTAATAWNSQLLEAQVSEMRSQSQMQFYTIQHLLPGGVADQMRVNLGISNGQTKAAAPAPAPVSPVAPEPVAAPAPVAPEPVQLHRVAPIVYETDFS